MHKNFLNMKQQESVVKGIKAFYETCKEKLQIEEKDNEMVSFIISKIEEKITVPNKKNLQKKNDESVVADESKENIAPEENEEAKEEFSKEMIGKKRKAPSNAKKEV